MRRLLTIVSRKATVVTILAAAIVAVIAEIVRNTLAGAAAISSSIISILLLLGFLLVLAQLDALRSSVDQLSRKAGLSIIYYPASKEEDEESRVLHLAAKGVIERAQTGAEIFAVNSYVEVFRESNDPAMADSQRDYLRTYKRRFHQLNTYHRLIQVKNGQGGKHETNLGDRLAPAYLEHYRDMAEHAERSRDGKIKLERVSARLPTSFVVVRNGTGGEIIWQINHHDPGLGVPDAERMQGVFIVSDPDGLLVPNFIDWFKALDTEESSPVKLAHLRTSDADER